VPYYYYKYREDIPSLSRTSSEGGSLRGWAHALSIGRGAMAPTVDPKKCAIFPTAGVANPPDNAFRRTLTGAGIMLVAAGHIIRDLLPDGTLVSQSTQDPSACCG
jgi:hypothetical protein